MKTQPLVEREGALVLITLGCDDTFPGMARKLRVEYSSAIYHLSSLNASAGHGRVF
jgi:hypothetical protein